LVLDDDTDLNPYQLQVPGNHNPPDVAAVRTRIYNNLSDKNGYLDLIPSTLDLMYVALGQANAQTKPIEERFRKFINSVEGYMMLSLLTATLQDRSSPRHPCGIPITF
jgi:chromosome partitioning protein